MNQNSRTSEPTVVTPSYPGVFRDEVRALIADLGGATFTKNVARAFRKPITRPWWSEFWKSLKSDTKAPKNIANELGVPPSTVSREDEVSTPVLLTFLVATGRDWGALPALPTAQSVGADCYIKSIAYAQAAYEMESQRRDLLDASPTGEQFELLLWLYREREWFDRRSSEIRMSEGERDVSETVRDAIAQRVIEQAELRLRTALQGIGRHTLEQLQSDWGYGFMIAIEAIRYRWEV